MQTIPASSKQAGTALPSGRRGKAKSPHSAPSTPPLQGAKELAREAEQAGRKRVEDEIKAYEDAGLVGEHDPLDLLQFWQNHMIAFSLLCRIALDVLPVQALAVPCERVFLSSKETDTNQRANLSPEKMEELQVLKERSVLDVSPDIVKDMYARGELAQLDKFISVLGTHAETLSTLTTTM